MRVEEIVAEANRYTGDFSEKDVVDFFKRKNVGHWPSERGEVVVNSDNGEIILTIGRKMVGSNRDLTAAGKIWLLDNFFNNFKPQALKDLEEIDHHKKLKPKPYEMPSVSHFHDRIVKRMSRSYTQFVKSGPNRLAFVERQRYNPDNSVLYAYDLNILDYDKTSKYALVLPSLNPTIKVFEEYKNKIVQSSIEVDGRVFEEMKPWERAEYIAMTHIDIFDYHNVSKDYLDAALLLTEALDVDSGVKFQNIVE